MGFSENLVLLRKNKGLSQEELAEHINVSRQAIGKWEKGTAFPDIQNLICLCDLLEVTIDKMVREESNCNSIISKQQDTPKEKLIKFLVSAKINTYAAHGAEVKSSRRNSHDLEYVENNMYYYDTYLGGERFTGEEAVWINDNPVWSMNYSGRVIGDNFNGDFLKEALMEVPMNKPFRGPEFYQKGDYSYHCKINGDFEWFQGYEEIIYNSKVIYECFFHGGIVI